MGIQKRLGFLLILCIMCQILCFTASAEGGCEVITNAANAISYSGFTPGENGIEVLSPGSVTYEFTVPKDGYYKLSMEMGFYLNINELGANGAAVAIQLDNSKMIALSKNNLIDKGKAPGWHKTNYEYLYSILLTSGTHQISFTSSVYEKQTPEFQLAKFIISPTNDTQTDPDLDGGTIHIPAVGDNVEFCDLKTDNGCISANRLGNVKYRFTVHETGYYNLNMDIGWAVTNPSSGAEVALKVDDRNSVVLTEQNMNFLGDTPNADQKQYAYRKQIYFETGIHTILFTSSRGEMPWCSFFFFGGLELNKNDNDNTALAEDLYEAEDAEPVDKYTADISLAAIDAYQVENFDKENDDHYAASLQGASLSYELNVLSEQAAYYWLYLNTDLTGSAEITIDGKPLVLFDGYMKEYSLIKGQPCSQHKVYKYYRPVQLTAGKHVLKVTNLGGSIWFGGLEFVNAGKPTSEYGAALTRKGVKKGRQVLMTVGSRTDKGVYVMDESFKVQYTSSDKTVASVDKNGRVEAISPGTAVIKAVLTSKDGSVVEYSDKLHVLPYFKGRISVKDASYDAQQGSLKAKVGAFYNQKQTEALVIAAVYGYDKANGMIGNLKFLQSETVSGMLADTECEIDFPVGSIDENTLVKLFVVDSSTPLGLWSYTFCREGSI